MRRWAAFAHGLDLPHYAVSIVRGRGIDTGRAALAGRAPRPGRRRVRRRLDGQGRDRPRTRARRCEQANAALGHGVLARARRARRPRLVRATFGTRDDFLVPSACLNSTVSGLVSRTVLNAARARARAVPRREVLPRARRRADVSRRFVDAVTARFADVAADVARDWPVAQAAPTARRPGPAGPTSRRSASEYGIGDVNLVKPGVGETTRVLLRRVPWAVLVRPGAGTTCATCGCSRERRGVPVHEVPGLTYSCVGLIHPRYTRGATGADGTAAR